MYIADLFILFAIVAAGVFLTGWLTPIIILVINRLLFQNVDPFLILIVCACAAVVADLLLWKFDISIHAWLDRKLHRKKPKEITKHKKWIARKASHWLWEKMQLINNKFILFFWIFFASFSIVPDLFIVEFSRQKFKAPVFATAMFFWKFIVYSPLIWGSIWFIELFSLI